MIFLETELPGAFVIDPEYREDERGIFARSFCAREFEERGLVPRIAQCNLSFNHLKGTVRGMHYQVDPHREVKVVRCTRGSILDVIIDLRPESPTFKRWIGVELSVENRRQLYVPTGFAHGYQTLEDCSEVAYQVSEFYAPGSERGVRWDDPAFGVHWPLPVSVISEKDSNHPAFEE